MKIFRISVIVFAFAIFFDFVIFSSSCMAQQHDASLQYKLLAETQAAPLLYPKRSLNTASLPFEIIGFDTSWVNVSDGLTHDTGVKIVNTSNTPISAYFSRSQRLPAGWSSSVCWGQTCYLATDSYEVDLLSPGDTALLTLDLTPALSDYPDSSIVWLRAGVVDSLEDTVQLVFMAGFTPGNTPIIFHWASGSVFHFNFSGTGSHSVSDILENHSGFSTNYYFSMQDSLPNGWSVSKYCVGSNCSTGADDTSSFDPSTGVNYRQKVNFTLQVPVLTKKDSAILFLSVHPQTENPLDSANYRFVAVVNSHLLDVVSNSAIAGGSADTITAQFKNLLTIPDIYHFSIRASLPAGWSLQNYCVGDSCSTVSDIVAPFDATGDATAIQNVTFALQTSSVTRQDTGILYLSSYPMDNPGDIRIDTLYALANPQSGVSSNADENAGLAVTNAWPNPVYGNGKLTLDILTDRSGPCVARIYDITGIEQATVDLGMLHVGANQAQIANPNIHSGEYIIRIEQGNQASEVVRVNYIR